LTGWNGHSRSKSGDRRGELLRTISRSVATGELSVTTPDVELPTATAGFAIDKLIEEDTGFMVYAPPAMGLLSPRSIAMALMVVEDAKLIGPEYRVEAVDGVLPSVV
jgi:hypothetical protein